MRLERVALVALVATTAFPTLAFAADAGAPKSDHEAATLSANIQEQLELLSRDCTTACRALQSIQRAADRICELEPGDRCKDARSKADDAARKVHASCPDCVIAQAPPRKDLDKQQDERVHAGESKKGSATSADAAPVPASAPQSESVKSGGCRSCNESGTSPSDFAPALLAIFAVLGLRKRRR